MKFGQFLCKNTDLLRGISFEIRSDNQTTILPDINATEGWKNYFSFPDPGSAFRLDIQSGGDEFVASFRPTVAFVIRKAGTFGAGNDDFMKIKIQDNLTGSSGGNLSQLECLAVGIREE